MGGRGQSAYCCHHSGRVCGDNGGDPSAREDPMRMGPAGIGIGMALMASGYGWPRTICVLLPPQRSSVRRQWRRPVREGRSNENGPCWNWDRNGQNGVWLWVAADNLRIAATTAVECAETMAATRPRGKIQ